MMAARRLAAMLVIALMAGCAHVPPPLEAAAPDDESERLTEQLARCRQLQRDDRRKLEQLARQLRAERQKSEAMRNKIESLRAIDREMMLERQAP